MNYNSLLTNYKTFYETYKEKIQLACDCINSNPCSILADEIENLKGFVLKPLYSLDWDDSVNDTFITNLQTCDSDLDILLTSINSSFTKSENIYKEINASLTELNLEIVNFETTINNKPRKSTYEKRNYGEFGNLLGYSYPGYISACEKWEQTCNSCNSKCLTIQNAIEDNLEELNLINGTNTEISGVMTSILSKPTDSTMFTTYNFNGSNYLILDINGGYAGVLAEVGSQRPDKCYHWAISYANNIIGKSGIETTGHSEFSTSDPDEVLQIAASELFQGRPTYVQVTGTHVRGDTYTRHFVTIAGIKENADLNNLKQSDFLILEPTEAMLKELDTDMSGYRTRSLFNAQNATYRSVQTNQYLIGVFSNADNYLSDTCELTHI